MSPVYLEQVLGGLEALWISDFLQWMVLVILWLRVFKSEHKWRREG